MALIECACSHNGKCSIGRDHSGLPYRFTKLFCQSAQYADLGPSSPQARARSQLRSPNPLKRIPYRLYAAPFRRTQQRPENLREHVRVFMRIEMSDGDSG